MSNPLLPLLLTALVIGVMAYPPFTGTDTLLTDIEESTSNIFGAGEWPATVKDVLGNNSQDRNASGNGTDTGSGSSLGGIVDLLDGDDDATDTPPSTGDAAPSPATGPEDGGEPNNTPPGNDTTTVTPPANDTDTAALPRTTPTRPLHPTTRIRRCRTPSRGTRQGTIRTRPAGIRPAHRRRTRRTERNPLVPTITRPRAHRRTERRAPLRTKTTP